MIANKQALGHLLLLVVAVFTLPSCGNRQPKTGPVVLNEVLVDNESGIVDGYGERSAWIELYNRTAATVDVNGCYLTNDRRDLKKYAIPAGDKRTKIAPSRHLLFYADGNASKGVFYTNFKLNKGEETFIALVASDGETILDSVTIPATLATDQSYCRIPDGNISPKDKEANNIWKVAGAGANSSLVVTPQENNDAKNKADQHSALKERDPHGGVMTLTAMLVVFLGLTLLFLAFKLTGYISVQLAQRRSQKTEKKPAKGVTKGDSAFIPGDVSAAIAMAIYEAQNEVHDVEGDVITLLHASRKYSPWSSKIYGLRTPLGAKVPARKNR